MGMYVREEVEEEEAAPLHLHGDILEAILAHVPPLYLLPASHVSKSWNYTITTSSVPSAFVSKPWLIVHVQNSRNHSIISTHAYDPNSQVWIDIIGAAAEGGGGAPPCPTPLKSSNTNLLYTIPGPTKLGFSSDALNNSWQFLNGSKVWRHDPVVAIIGTKVVVAGGVYGFEDDPLSVETYDVESKQWRTCEPFPSDLKESVSATYHSVVVSDTKMYLLEKYSGKLCSFDPKRNTWEEAPFDLRPCSSIYFSTIGILSNNRLVLTALIGDAEDVQSLRLWEVNCDKFDCKEITKMPSELLKILRNNDSSLSSINTTVVEDFMYIYNTSNPQEIVYCDLSNGICQWGNIPNPIINDRNWIHKFVFTSSKVGFNDLHKVSGSGSRKFIIRSPVKLTEKVLL